MKLNKYASMKNILYSVYNGTWTVRQLGLCDDNTWKTYPTLMIFKYDIHSANIITYLRWKVPLRREITSVKIKFHCEES